AHPPAVPIGRSPGRRAVHHPATPGSTGTVASPSTRVPAGPTGPAGHDTRGATRIGSVSVDISDERQIRLSDADRERAVERLNDAVAEGRLTLSEFEERM